MADQADDRCVRHQLKVLTGLKLPGFNWKANNMRMEFNIFWHSEVCAGDSKGPLHSTAAWQRGDGVMDY